MAGAWLRLQVNDLGSGAYATVEHCQLANWRDPSQHGARGGGGALAALERRSYPPGLDTAAEGYPLGEGATTPQPGAGGSGGGGRRRPFVGWLGLRRGFGGRDGSGRGVRHAPGRRPALLDVAVKHLRPSLFDCQADLEDFVREAVLLATLQHRWPPCTGARHRSKSGSCLLRLTSRGHRHSVHESCVWDRGVSGSALRTAPASGAR